MTNEEAIKTLKANVMVACDTSDRVGYDTPLNKAIEQALEMAIKALEQQPCEDAVSRQAVNELFDSEIKMYKERIETRKGSNYHDETERIREFRSRIANAEYWQDKIKALPSVTPAISEIDKFNDSVNRATVLALINDVKNADGFKEYSQYEYLFDQVDKMPMAVPARKKGKWVKSGQSFVNPNKFLCYSCSECGSGTGKVKTKFCPDCGAEMENVENDK